MRSWIKLLNLKVNLMVMFTASSFEAFTRSFFIFSIVVVNVNVYRLSVLMLVIGGFIVIVCIFLRVFRCFLMFLMLVFMMDLRVCV